jgi:hypothetical protein
MILNSQIISLNEFFHAFDLTCHRKQNSSHLDIAAHFADQKIQPIYFNVITAQLDVYLVQIDLVDILCHSD